MHCMGQNIKSLAACVCECVCECVCAHGTLGSNISKTFRDRASVSMDNQYQMAYGESIGHMIDDVT